jgi:DNA-directed RNA polymerase subunit M/transcription elongation factor TFIIS
MVKTIVCPKCKKAVIRRKTRTDTNYWDVKCLWCGNTFKKAKTHVKAKDRKKIEGGK